MMPDSHLKALIKAAEAACQKAYAPYSQFQVGAAILDNNNNIHSGCNVENSAYPIGCCAEQAAVAAMVLAGGETIKNIVIKAAKNNPCPPCGACRQIIAEQSTDETRIHLIGDDQSIHSFTVDDMLPHAFTPSHFK